MLKKTMIFFMAICLFLSCSAICFAEIPEAVKLASDGQFTFHNGTMFGESYADINNKDSLFKSSVNKLYNQSEGVEGRTNANGTAGTLAGIKKGYASYFFIDDAMSEIQYYFGGFNDFSMTTADYSTYYQTLYNALCEKYGTPLGNGNYKYYPIKCESLTVCDAKLYDFVTDPLKYDEWVVDCGSYYVKIDLCALQYDDTNECYITLGYKPFTDNDLAELENAAEAAKIAEEQARMEEEQMLKESMDNDL